MKAVADDPASPVEELQRQARTWLRLLTSMDARECDVRGFKQWLQKSPAHQAAFGEAKRRWDLIEPASRAFLRTHPREAHAHAQALRGPGTGRRAFMGAALGAAAVAGMAVAYPPAGLWPSPAQWGADDSTGTGEQRTFAWTQGVQVTLNTQTRIRRRHTDGTVGGIDLLSGEAAVDFDGNGGTFQVFAGAGHAVAQTGQFEVRHLDDKVCVTCLRGSVQVDHPAGTRLLRARQQTVYDDHALSGVAAVEPANVSAWRRGELVFSDARLVDVVAEINRYRPGRVVLMRASARQGMISGRFLIASLDSVVAQIEQMYGLQAHPLPGGIVILS